jgi:hypothetical protein
MSGRMTLDIDRTVPGPPFPMKGSWVFQEGLGTHHGVCRVEGTAGPQNPDGLGMRPIGSGTYTGWVRNNK